MEALACLAKTLVLTIVALVPAIVLSVLLTLVGVPTDALPYLWAASMAALAGYVANDVLESDRVWLWAVGGGFLGFLIVPVLVFACQWDQATQRARFLVALPAPGGDRVVV